MLFKKRSGKTLIFRMDRDEIRIALLNLSNSDPVPEFTTIIETPEGAIEDGDIKRPDLLEQALQPVLAQTQYKRVKKAIFTICTGQVISETVTIPAVSEKKLEKMLQANMDMYFPVSTANHHLVYHILDTVDGEDGKELKLQLWAIPREMMVSYYALANILGLGIVAMDYCGNSLVSGVGASFAKPEERDAKGRLVKEKKPKKAKKEKKPSRFGKKKNAEQDETYQPEITPEGKVETPVVEEETPPTELYLVLEEEHIIATFVQNNRVKMQRIFLTGYSIAAELDEVRLTLDYFTTQENVDLDKMTAVVCGKLANDPLIVGDVESALDLPVVVWNCPGGPEWTLNVGAAKSQKDFGIPNLAKQLKGPSPVKTRWQAYVLLASMAFMVGSVSLTTFSNLGWAIDLSSLKDSLNLLRVQEAQNNGNADAYYEYEMKYEAYSYDWDLMFANLRTYNDNLSKMLGEIEKTIPKEAAVVTIGIADEGLGLQFACEDKEMAAYLIMSLRDLKYADLADISNLSVGPGATAQDMLPSLAAANQMNANSAYGNGTGSGLGGVVNGAVNGAINGAADALNGIGGGENAPGTGEVAPKTGASNMSITELMALAESMGIDINDLSMEEKLQLYQMYQNGELDQYIESMGGGAGTGTDDKSQKSMAVVGQAIKEGVITEDDVEDALDQLSEVQLDILEKYYGDTPDAKKDMKTLRKKYTDLKPRQKAIEEMLTTDRFAIYRFHKVFMEDLKRDKGKSYLYDDIADELWEKDSLLNNMISGDVDQMLKTMPELIDILTRDEKTVSATEDLMQTDKQKNNGLYYKYPYYWCVEEELQKSSKKAGTLDVDDLMGDIVTGDLNANDDELEAVVDALVEILLIDTPELKEEWEEIQGGTISKDDLLGEEEEEIVDTRIHFAVALSYKPELIEAEQYHKGLPYYAKLNKVEVE